MFETQRTGILSGDLLWELYSFSSDPPFKLKEFILQQLTTLSSTCFTISRSNSTVATKKTYSRTPLIRTLIIRNAKYSDWFVLRGNFTGYRIKYSTVLWLLELQIRRGRKVKTQVRIVNTRSNSRSSYCQCSLFSVKNSIIRIFCISGYFTVLINPDKWSSTVFNAINFIHQRSFLRKQSLIW